MSASKLYTAYRAEDDALLVFEQPAARGWMQMSKFDQLYDLFSQQKAAKIELADLEVAARDGDCIACKRCKALRDRLTDIERQIDATFAGGDENG